MRMKTGLLGLAFLSQSFAQITEEEPFRYIVKYKASNTPALIKKLNQGKFKGFQVIAVEDMAGGAYILHFQGPQFTAKEQVLQATRLLSEIRKDENVLYAVKDRVGHIQPLPEDSETRVTSQVLSHALQWDEFSPPAGVMLESLPNKMDGAWAYTRGEAMLPVVIAVLDTGIVEHESLSRNLLRDEQGNIWGWNFADFTRDVSDDTGSYHGTHVAGTIAGYGQVIQGMGEYMKILPLKIPGKNGMFYESSVINAMYWSVGGEVPRVPHNPYPAKALNMSFGVDAYPGKELDYCDAALQEAIFYVRNKGAVLVAAAGNDNRWEHYNAPAVCNGVVKVASTGPEGLRSYFSNYGPSVTLAAPGGDKRNYGEMGGILSAVHPQGGIGGTGYAFYQGTSMASPHVAGIVGLVNAASRKNLSAEKVEKIIYVTTHAFGASKDNKINCVEDYPCGHGIIDAKQAVLAAIAEYDVLLTAPSLKSVRGQCHVKTIRQQGVEWSMLSGSCSTLAKSATHSLYQDKAGQIYAQYGQLKYRLKTSSYRSCQLVGFDGIGCYR